MHAQVPVLSDTVANPTYLTTAGNFDPNAFVQSLPGISGPLGFFDPAGFCASSNGANGAATEGKVRFYREVEVKHARVAMLAAFGFPVAEQWHPLFATDDAPSFSTCRRRRSRRGRRRRRLSTAPPRDAGG